MLYEVITVITDGFDNLMVAIDDVEHPIRKTGFLQEKGDLPSTERDFFRWFQDHAVPQRDRIGNSPVGDVITSYSIHYTKLYDRYC